MAKRIARDVIDADDLKHRGSELIYERVKHLSIAEEVAYWAQGTKVLRALQEDARQRAPTLPGRAGQS